MNEVLLNGDPICPSKIVCVGRNYVAHIKELGNAVPDEMVVFLKPNSAIGDELLACHQEPLHYEAELCFIVVDAKLFAVGIGLDLTKRTLQSQLKQNGLPWERAKAFNHSALFSEFVALDIDTETLDGLSLELLIDGELVQQGSCQQMLHSPQAIIDSVSEYMHFEDGDIIMTGTPKGVGQVSAGASFVGRVLLNGKTLCQQTWQAI